MSEWQPISTYDALKEKPKHAVFFFKATPSGRMTLAAHTATSRYFGSRVCTHWIPLPDLPEDK